jgi:hypothetical protein
VRVVTVSIIEFEKLLRSSPNSLVQSTTAESVRRVKGLPLAGRTDTSVQVVVVVIVRHDGVVVCDVCFKSRV